MSKEEVSKYFKTLERHFMERVTLTEDELQHIRSLFSVRKLLPRQYLLSEGDICRYEHYVCEGFLRSFYVDENGNEHTLHFAKEDWWITDLGSFLNQEPASRNIVALEPTILLQIDLSRREQLMKDIPKMERFWRMLNEKACVSSDQRILNNISMSGQQRYLALLNKYPDIEQRLPQKHIASFLGMTPVFLSQIRKELAKK